MLLRILTGLFCFYSVVVQAQTLFFSDIGVEDGLPSNVTNSVLSDAHGFVWIGTQDGLCRFDGFKTKIFRHSELPNSIPANNISTLLADDDLIWVGTWDGLCTINTKNFSVKHIQTGESRTIRALYKDAYGNIWIGTANGLIMYEKKQDKYIFYDAANSGLSHNTIRTLYRDSRGDLWVGTYDKLNRLHAGKFTTFDLKLNYKPWLKNNLICTIKPYSETHDSLLWVGTETGLCLFDTGTGKFVVYNANNTAFSNEVVKCVFVQNDSTLWLGTDFGLNIFDPNTRKVRKYFHDPKANHTISNNVVWDIVESPKGMLWFVTSDGISLLDIQKNLMVFHEVYSQHGAQVVGNQVRALLVDSDGDTWSATNYGVICQKYRSEQLLRFTASENPKTRILLDNVFALAQDKQRRIWIGTAGGINIWDKNKQQMLAISASRQNGLNSNYIHSFAKETERTIWMSAWEGGLFKIIENPNNPHDFRFISLDNETDEIVFSAGKQMFTATKKELWLVDRQSFERTLFAPINEALAGKEISAVMGDSLGNIWVAADSNLLHYLPQSNSVQTTNIDANGLKKIIGLQRDRHGEVWGITHNTIVKFDTPQHTYLTIPIPKNSPLKTFYEQCCALTKDGNLLFGGDNGYFEINPKSVVRHSQKPKVFITELLINNQLITAHDSTQILENVIAFTKKIRLSHEQNSLTLEFSALEYLFPKISEFSFRLLGAETSWRSTSGAKNFAMYANLEPGEYTFELKGMNFMGNWSDAVQLHITILRPLWLRPPFLLLYLVLLMLLIVASAKFVRYRQQMQQELKLSKLEKEHADEIFRTKQQFFTNISHEFRTPLTLILPPIQEILRSNELTEKDTKLLVLANRNALRLSKLVNQLLDFAKIESSKLALRRSQVELVAFCNQVFGSFADLAKRNEINYRFECEMAVLYTSLDLEKIETVLFNVLSNAFKYTPYNGEISFKLSQFEEQDLPYIRIEICDNGMGIEPADQQKIFDRFYQTTASKAMNVGSGIGLTLSMEYVRLHGGDINLESVPEAGSCFGITLPFVAASAPKTDDLHPPAVRADTEGSKPATEVNPGKKLLLIVDDNTDILDFIELNLGDYYRFIRATDGRKGLEKCRKHLPDLIISDIMMPEMDGIALCKELKKTPATAHIPVILLTAKSLEVQKAEGLDSGADMYIIKPFDIDFLKSSVASVFRRNTLMYNFVKTEMSLVPGKSIDPEKNQDAVFLKRIIDIIEENIDNSELSVEFISDKYGISTTHLYRKMKQITNKSTVEVVKNYRMQRAAQLISNNEGNISEIMYAVGFSSPSSFSKAFKSVFGVSPAQYAELPADSA